MQPTGSGLPTCQRKAARVSQKRRPRHTASVPSLVSLLCLGLWCAQGVRLCLGLGTALASARAEGEAGAVGAGAGREAGVRAAQGVARLIDGLLPVMACARAVEMGGMRRMLWWSKWGLEREGVASRVMPGA